MPQLVPFYFLNQLLFGFTCGIFLLYFLSKFILPLILQIRLSRIYIDKLTSVDKLG